MHIVLVEPEIPQNTGNIARTCALTRSKLHLIQPLGFSLEDRYLKRAGLDYWPLVDLKVWDDFSQFQAGMKNGNIYLATTKADRCYQQVNYGDQDAIVFGCETKGLPASILEAFPDSRIRIPMLNIGRSLNLGNSAAIILYEALRQLDFNGLK
ncbi:MAG: tRNA (cytidine(34)-2'-O)-methyltransferase [Syntrophomonadaceae bacterium]|jgi:tRNA (cytidine/uridine-2'-O-)-methyltransferase|nr:tRNA (cytidine(34)-2'-O)-methyltransferase [Syntrophomonadaceae bacterium]